MLQGMLLGFIIMYLLMICVLLWRFWKVAQLQSKAEIMLGAVDDLRKDWEWRMEALDLIEKERNNHG